MYRSLHIASLSELVLVLAAAAVPASPAREFNLQVNDTGPRLTIVLFDYSGAEQGEAKNQFSRFKGLLRDKIMVWSEELGQLRQGAPFLEHLALFPSDSGPLPDTLANLSDVHNYWDRMHALELLRGIVQPGNDTFFVQSRIYLGDLKGTLPKPSVAMTLPITAREFANASDSHSLVTYYALAMEAKRLQCPSGIMVELLSRAKEKAADLRKRGMADPDINSIITAVDAALGSVSTSAGVTP